jgi:hypothetical protein
MLLAISRKDKSIKQKTKAGESEEKDKTFSAMWKKTKVFSKSSPLLNTLLLVLRCLAAYYTHSIQQYGVQCPATVTHISYYEYKDDSQGCGTRMLVQ